MVVITAIKPFPLAGSDSGGGHAPCLRVDQLVRRKRLVDELSGTLGADDRQRGLIDQPELRKHGGLIPVDMLMPKLVAAELHHGNQRNFNAFASRRDRSEEHTSELQSLMRISYAVFCLQKHIKSRDINNKHTARLM